MKGNDVKKLITLFALLALVFAPTALARMTIMISGGGVPAAGCSGSAGQASENRATIGALDYTYISQTAADCSGNVTQLQIYREDGSGDILVAVFTDNGGNNLTGGSATTITISVGDGVKTLNAPGDFTAFAITAGQYIGYYANNNVKSDFDWGTGDGIWSVQANGTGATDDYGTDTSAQGGIYAVITN